MALRQRYQNTYYRPQVRIVEGVVAGLIIAVIGGVLVFKYTLHTSPILTIPAGFPILDTLIAFVVSWFGGHHVADAGMTWQTLSYRYPVWTHAFQDHFAWSGAAGIFFGTVTAVLLAKPLPYERHIRGRQLVEKRAAVRAARASEKKDIKRTGAGIQIHPSVLISEERERRSFAIVGSPGGGKTTVIMPMIVQTTERNDKVIAYDNKGYYTERLPSDFILIAPWDTRGTPWAVWKDCKSGADARELATRLVLETHEPMWSNAARLVLTGLLIHLQQTGEAWGWKDLSRLLNLPIEGLQAIIQVSYPEAWRPVEIASRTTQSILITLSAYMAQVHDMARVWGNAEDGFSVTEFLADEYKGLRTVILQGNQKFTEMQNAIVNGIMAMASAHINSPAMSDSTTRRIWVYLDEAPQLKKAEWIQAIVAVGRSKGVRVLLGVQDVAQLRQIYGRDQTESWTSMIGTYIFTQLGGNDTAKWVSEYIGTREIERYEVSHSTNSQQILSGNRQRTESYRRMEDRVIKQDELQTLLGPEKSGVQALLHLGDFFEYLLVWPYVHAVYPPIRPAWNPSEWVSKPPPRIEIEADGEGIAADDVGLAHDMKLPQLADDTDTLPSNEPKSSAVHDSGSPKRPPVRIRTKEDAPTTATLDLDLDMEPGQ